MAQKHPAPYKRKPLRLREFDSSDQNRAYFVTLCAKKGTKPFETVSLAEAIVQGLDSLRTSGKCSVFSFCLMPDHLHIILSPTGEERTLSDVIRDLKSYTTRCAWELGWTGRLWQRSYYDHVGRQREDLVKMCEYVNANPVRAKLVGSVSDWPYCGQPDPFPS
jgi:REP element-mobilizing transposase RayT